MDKNILLIKKNKDRIKQDIINSNTNKNLLNELQKYDLNIFSNNSKNIAILIESRVFNNAELILRQFSRFLPKDFAMWIYVTQNVYNKWLELVKKLNNNINVILLPSKYKLNSIKDYNNIMLDVTFWKLLNNFERVLIFQMDTMIYRTGIEQFYIYDYIGAPWPNKLFNNLDIGNGGLSLRNIKAVLYCLENKNRVIIPKYPERNKNIDIFNTDPEDVFFAIAMKQFGYNLPSAEIASQFSIESGYHNSNCLGSHKLYSYNLPLYNELLYKSIFNNNPMTKL
jgi:hypothetical protein